VERWNARRGGWLDRLGALVGRARRLVDWPAEARFRRLAEDSLQAILIHDGHGRKFANTAYARMFGYPDVAAVLRATDVRGHVLPEDRPALDAHWQAILAGRPTWFQERCRRVRLDGSIVWIDLTLGPTTWEGRPAIQAIQVEVTREVEAVRELERSEARFRLLAEEAVQAIMIHDGTRRLFVNRAFTRLLGYPDIAAALADDIWQHVPTTLRDTIAGENRKTRDGEQIWTQRRVPRRRLDGTPIWLDVTRGPITWDDQPAVQVSFVDVTAQVEAEAALRRSERRLGAVLDNLPHVLTLKGADRKLSIVNRAFETHYGLNAAEAIGKTPEEVGEQMPGIQMGAPDVRADDLVVLATGRQITRERRRLKPNGERWDSIRTKFPVRGPDGTIEGVGTIITDVTALKRAQAQLEQREADLQRNQAALLRMLYDELGGSSPGDRIRRILEIAGVTLGVDAVSVWRHDGPAGLVRCLERWQRRERGKADRMLPMTLPLADIAPLYRILQDRLVVAFDAERTDPTLAQVLGTHYRNANTTATLAALVRLPDGQQIHVGFGQHDTRRIWSVEDESFARSIAELVRVCLLQAAIEEREQALRRSEARFRAIIDNLPHVLTVKDEQRRFQVVNRAFLEWFGVTADQIVGKTPEELAAEMPLIGPLARPQARDLEREVVDTGQVVARESMRMTAAGEHRDLMTVRFAVRDEAGAIDGIGLVATDITTLKSAQAQLVRRETDLRRNQAALLQALRDESSGGSLHERIHNAMRLAGETLGADTVSFWMRDGETLRCVDRWCRPGSRHGVDDFARTQPFAGFVEFYRQLQARLVLPQDSARNEKIVAHIHESFYQDMGFSATLAAFIRLPAGQEAHFGVGIFDTPRAWSAEDESFARSLAELVRVWFLQDVLESRETELSRNQAALLQMLRDEQSASTLDDRIQRAIRLAGETLGADAVAVWRREADGDVVRAIARWCPPDGPRSPSDFPASVPFADYAELYALLRERLVLASDHKHPLPNLTAMRRRHWGAVNMTATLSALIRMPDGQEAHFGASVCGTPRVWSAEDETFARSVAELIRVWILQDTLESREQALQRNQVAVLEALRDELSGGPIEGRLQRILALAGATLGVDGAALWRVDADAGLVRCAARWRAAHLSLGDADFPTAIPLESARVFYEELERRIVLSLEDHRADPRFAAFLDENWPNVPITSSLAALIQRPGVLQDYVVFSHYGELRAWSVEDQSFARSIAELIGIVLFQDAFERREQALRRNQETLIRIVREGLLGGGTTPEILDSIVRIAGTTLGLTRVSVWAAGAPFVRSDRACVALWEPGRPSRIPPDIAPIPTDQLRSWLTDDYFAELERDFMVAIDDLASDPRLTELGRSVGHPPGTGARLVALVQLPDRIACVVSFLAGPGPRRWSGEDRAFARSVADLVGFVLLSERHRQALAALDLVSQGIYVEDARGDVLYANRVARQLAGAASDTPLELAALPALPRENGAAVGPDAVGELAWRLPDGERRDLSVARTALPSAGAVTVMADVTELKRREQERRALEAEMRQAAKLEAIGRLAGGIAHDFNNLLGTVLGFTGFLQEDLPPESVQHEYATRIAQASEHAKEVVKQLLAFTRTSDVERHVMDLRKVLGDSHDLLRASLPSSTRLTVDAGRDALPVLVNSTQIHQILLNLCLNANDALGGEPGKVVLSLTHTAAGAPELLAPAATNGAAVTSGGHLRPDRGYARLTVTDSGTGMDAATIARVFDPFFTTKSPGRGTGLGLAVVHGIVAAYEGAYLVESRPGDGTSFSLFLPLAETATPALEPQRPIDAFRGTESILVVDDERDLLDMMCIGLQRLGYSATGCADPLLALETFRAEPGRFAAVVTDEVMPGLKGSALVAKLREIRPALPIVLCTGFSDGATERQARQAGAAGFFLKPVEPARIAETIRTLLDAEAHAPRVR
jgi:PAS domain S-box-containing protein